nr:hypothetical protein BaRGS_034922 [Batillaria attramentaria]
MGYHEGPYQHGFHGPGMGGDGQMGGFPNTQSPAVIEAKPKVIYSAPPVRTVPKKAGKGKSEKKQTAGDSNTASLANQTTDIAAVAAASSEVGAEMEGAMGQELEEDTTIADMELDMDLAAPTKREKKEKKKKFIRTAAGQAWEDPTLAEWDPDDFRMFCGDLGNEVTDEVLTRAFSKYPSFVKAKVIRDRRSNKTKGYGFASFKDPVDFTRAMREMNGLQQHLGRQS